MDLLNQSGVLSPYFYKNLLWGRVLEIIQVIMYYHMSYKLWVF